MFILSLEFIFSENGEAKDLLLCVFSKGSSALFVERVCFDIESMSDIKKTFLKWKYNFVVLYIDQSLPFILDTNVPVHLIG